MMFTSPDFDPQRIALRAPDGGGGLTYAELSERVEEGAASLRRETKGLALVPCRNDIPSVLAYLAALEAGHAAALVDADASDDSIADLVRRYGPDWVLRRDSGAVDWLGGDHRLEATGALETGSIHADLALLLATSGSTGSPKFVRLSHRALTSNAEAIAHGLALRSDEIALASLPIHYSYGLSILNSHLAVGATCILTDRGPLDRSYWDLVRGERCTSSAGVPYTYQVLQRLRFDRMELPELRTMTQAGGRLDPRRVEYFADIMETRGGAFVTMYGQTEATARIAIMPRGWARRTPDGVGRVVENGSIAIDAAPAERDGEIVFRGPSVMMGYATARTDLAHGDVLGGTLRTGDIGYQDGDGILHVTGRIKRIAKICGTRIGLDQVEHLAAPVWASVAAIERSDRILVFCEGADQETVEAMASRLRDTIRIHPSAISVETIDRIPRTPSGKIDYGGLD